METNDEEGYVSLCEEESSLAHMLDIVMWFIISKTFYIYIYKAFILNILILLHSRKAELTFYSMLKRFCTFRTAYFLPNLYEFIIRDTICLLRKNSLICGTMYFIKFLNILFHY